MNDMSKDLRNQTLSLVNANHAAASTGQVGALIGAWL